ncbi:MAG: ParB N-terminal domain-containing protein [Microgenomates group bacterium]
MTYRMIDIASETAVAPDPGPAPMLQWVNIDQLVIDDRYQRPLGPKNWINIRKIAAGFRWSMFSPLLVAPIEGGRYAVIDGQHRAHAAAICGLAQVPCQVVMVPPEEQARAFGGVNGSVTAVHVSILFRAACAAGDADHVAVVRAVEAAGCQMAKHNVTSSKRQAGTLYCYGLLLKLIRAGQADAVTSGLAALKRYDTTGRVGLWSNFILNPWLWAVADSGAAPDDLDRVLAMRDPFKVIDGADGKARHTFSRMISAAGMRGAA